MKKVLIISPYFPPANTADMQRIRMSLPYFKEVGWHAEVVTCHPKYYETNLDELLLQSISTGTKIHTVKALDKKWTSKLGLGSLALRSLWFYKQKVNEILKKEKFDLIYFSTTEFPICILGRYWKQKFNISYVIDMQDPWHSNYYEDKPKNERPPKYWFSYRLNKWLEPIAMKKVDGLIAVSNAYNTDLINRYQLNIPTATITFGHFDKDLEIAQNNQNKYPPLIQKNECINIGYIGRGGYDMHEALEKLFKAFKFGLEQNLEGYKRIRFYFIGTSYAKNGTGQKTIQPLAEKFGLENYVTELTDRIPFYQTLNTLANFDALFICGSNDKKYTASKIYPYIQLNKPLLGILHKESSAFKIIKDCNAGTLISFEEPNHSINAKIEGFLTNISINKSEINFTEFKKYSAQEMTKKQCLLFDRIIK